MVANYLQMGWSSKALLLFLGQTPKKGGHVWRIWEDFVAGFPTPQLHNFFTPLVFLETKLFPSGCPSSAGKTNKSDIREKKHKKSQTAKNLPSTKTENTKLLLHLWIYTGLHPSNSATVANEALLWGIPWWWQASILGGEVDSPYIYLNPMEKYTLCLSWDPTPHLVGWFQAIWNMIRGNGSSKTPIFEVKIPKMVCNHPPTNGVFPHQLPQAPKKNTLTHPTNLRIHHGTRQIFTAIDAVEEFLSLRMVNLQVFWGPGFF